MPSFFLTRKSNSGRYYAVAYDKMRTPKRKWVSLRTRDKVAAKQALARMEKDTAFGKFDPWNREDAADKGLIISEAVSEFLRDRSHLSPKTLRGYTNALGLLDRSVPIGLMLRSLTADHINGFIRGRKLSRASQASYFGHIRAFLNWCESSGHIDENPIKGVPIPKAPNNPAPFLQVDETKRLLTAIEEPWLAHIVRFAVCTGLRRGELINLRWRHVDLGPSDAWVTVKSHGDFETKSGHGRAVPLVADAKAVLEERYGDTYAPDAYVFTDGSGARLSGDRVSKAFKRVVRLAGLDDSIHFHSLRHSCASWLVMNGQSLLFVAKILGHSSTQVAQRYAHLAPDAIAHGMQRALGGISLGARSKPARDKGDDVGGFNVPLIRQL